jgi:hypothetical protein
MKRTLGQNSILVYLLPILIIGIFIFAIFSLTDQNLILILVLFVVILVAHLGYLVRPKNCILVDQKYLYLYPIYTKEVILDLKDIVDVKVENYLRRSNGPKIRVKTKSGLTYKMSYVSSPYVVAKEIMQLVSKVKNLNDPFEAFDTL